LPPIEFAAPARKRQRRRLVEEARACGSRLLDTLGAVGRPSSTEGVGRTGLSRVSAAIAPDEDHAGSQPTPASRGENRQDKEEGMLALIRARLTSEEGQALVEYALILSLIAVVAIAALTLTGVRVDSIISKIANNL
jgi:pilus assembly protein Flp/PilA